jgi:hypothetical protein
MRVWIMLGIGALMLATAVWPSGAWGATLDDVRKEMAENPTPWHGTRLLMYVPMVGSGNTLVAMTNLCVSGGRLRPIDGANVDVGPAPKDNQYLVHIVMRDGGGYDIYQYERMVTLPNCK